MIKKQDLTFIIGDYNSELGKGVVDRQIDGTNNRGERKPGVILSILTW